MYWKGGVKTVRADKGLELPWGRRLLADIFAWFMLQMGSPTLSS